MATGTPLANNSIRLSSTVLSPSVGVSTCTYMPLSDDTNALTDPVLKSNLICDPERPCGRVKDCALCAFARIRELQDELTRIKHENYHERIAYNRVHDPLIRMPPELMSLIFRFAIQFEYPWADNINSYLIESNICYIRPIWLASVCARWRQIALGDPILWSNINITYCAENPHLERKSWTPSLELVEQWISRSRALPLGIVLKWDDAPESEDGTLGDIIEALCEQCHRWRALYIEVPAEAMLRFQSAGLEGVIDLDYLHISHGDPAGLVPNPWSMGYKTLSPRHASLQSPPAMVGSLLWTNMVTLKISSVNHYECLDIVRQTKRLECLKVFAFGAEVESNSLPPTTPIMAACLQEIEVGFIENIVVEEFFLNIRAPVLESLTLIRYTDIGTHVPLDFLAPMLLESDAGAKLRDLTMVGVACSSEDLMTLLWGLNKLTQISMMYRRDEDILPPLDNPLGTLAATPSVFDDPANGVSFLPQLSALSYSGHRTFEWSAIADVLHAHSVNTPSKRPLKFLTISALVPPMVPQNYIDKETLARLLALQPSSEAKLNIKEELFLASFEHHGMDYPLRALLLPRHIITYPKP